MNITLKKSRYHKPSTKSGNEDNNPEVEELKKYRELIEKLGNTCQKKKVKRFKLSIFRFPNGNKQNEFIK